MSKPFTIQLNGAPQAFFAVGAGALPAPIADIGANLDENMDIIGSWDEEEFAIWSGFSAAVALPAAAVALPAAAGAAPLPVVVAPPPAPAQMRMECERCLSDYLTDNNREGWVLDGAEWCCSANCANRVQCTECTRLLGRDTRAWAQSGVCSYNCHSVYLARSIPEDDEEEGEGAVDIHNL